MASAVSWPVRVVFGAVSLALWRAMGSGRSGAGEHDATAAPPAAAPPAAVVTPSTGARRSVRGGMRCAACAADRPASAFSASQRKQTAARRRCIECVEGDRQPHTQPAQTQPAQTQPAQTQPAPQSALPEAGSAGALALPAAASSPFALAAAHALAPGMSWPHAVTYRGVPPLYPAPALWVRDIPGFLAELPAGLRRPQLRLMLQAYQNQFELDERFALLQWAYAHAPLAAACKARAFSSR